MDDHALLAEFAADGKAEAFAELSRRYQPLVNAAARRETADAHLAEDITQSTMMVLMRKAGGIRPGKPLGPWLLRVAHYLAVDALRNESARRRHEQSASRQRSETSAIPQSTPWRNIEPVLDQALNALTENDRTILVLRYLQEWSIDRVGRELGLSAEATRQRLSRALRRLRKLLAHRGIDDECLIPIAAPIAKRGAQTPASATQWLSRVFGFLRARAVVAIGAFSILACGIALTHAALHRAPANPGAAIGPKAPAVPPMSNSRPDSTVP